MRLSLLCVLCVFLSSCFHWHDTRHVVDVTNMDFSEPMVKGESCGYYIFGLFGPLVGNGGIAEAVESGQIRKIKLVEEYAENLILVAKTCTVVYGTSRVDDTPDAQSPATAEEQTKPPEPTKQREDVAPPTPPDSKRVCYNPQDKKFYLPLEGKCVDGLIKIEPSRD